MLEKISNSSTNTPTTSKSSKSIKWLFIATIVIVAFAILAVGGFFGIKIYIEKSVETAVEQAITDKVNKNAGIPDSFPTDNLLYPNAEVLDSAETGNDVTLRLKTSHSVSKAAEYYNDKLGEIGWTKVTASNFSGSSTLNAEKEGKTIYIFISTDQKDKKTMVLINITSASP